MDTLDKRIMHNKSELVALLVHTIEVLYAIRVETMYIAMDTQHSSKSSTNPKHTELEDISTCQLQNRYSVDVNYQIRGPLEHKIYMHGFEEKSSIWIRENIKK